MPDEGRLREQAARSYPERGTPSLAPDRTWGGPGVGADCTVCGKPVPHTPRVLTLSTKWRWRPSSSTFASGCRSASCLQRLASPRYVGEQGDDA